MKTKRLEIVNKSVYYDDSDDPACNLRRCPAGDTPEIPWVNPPKSDLPKRASDD